MSMKVVIQLPMVLGALLFVVNSLPCEDALCRTAVCDDSGGCICNLPHPSSILDGDRPFLGGKFCDEEMTMCDGTNSFWCEHGGMCQEIIQGENYTCKCPPGFVGEHCQHSGARCGRIFCFHEAECLVEAEGGICECPPDWKGSFDCSLPTNKSDSSTDSMMARFPSGRNHRGTNWGMVLLAIFGSAGTVVGGALWANKVCSEREAGMPKFQQLSQMEIRSVVEDDEEDNENEAMIPGGVHHNDDSPL